MPAIEKCDGDLARQLRRAGSSQALNVAEGNGRRGRDRVQFFCIARGSANEVAACLRIAVSWRYLKQDRVERATGLAREVSKMLSALIR